MPSSSSAAAATGGAVSLTTAFFLDLLRAMVGCVFSESYGYGSDRLYCKKWVVALSFEAQKWMVVRKGGKDTSLLFLKEDDNLQVEVRYYSFKRWF